MIKRLDRAVLTEVVVITLISVFGLTFLFSAISLYRIVNSFAVTPHISTLASIAPSLWISLMPLTVPISALFAAALVFGRMRADRELLLLAAAGVAPWRPFVPLLLVGLLAALVSGYGVSEMGPDAYAERHALQRRALADFIDHPPPGPRELRFPGKGGDYPSIDISYQDVQGNRYEGLTILLYNDMGLLASLTTERATLDYQRFAGRFELRHCIEPRLIQFDPQTGTPTGTPVAAEKLAILTMPFDFGTGERVNAPKGLHTLDLLLKVRDDARRHTHERGAAAEVVRRLGLAAAGLLLPLLGALLASLVNHPNRLLSMGAGVIPCALVYYPLLAAAAHLAERAEVPAIVAALIAPGTAVLFCLLIPWRQTRGRWI